jgi:hypothetical protein
MDKPVDWELIRWYEKRRAERKLLLARSTRLQEVDAPMASEAVHDAVRVWAKGTC